MALDVKNLHLFLDLFLSGIFPSMPPSLPRDSHGDPDTQPCFDRSWLWEKMSKKLRPSAHPTSKAGMVAGLPAGSCELPTAAAAWIHSPLLQAISADLARTTRQRDEVSVICTSNQPNTNTHISKTPWLCPLAFWTTIAGSSSDSKALAFPPHPRLLRLALRQLLRSSPLPITSLKRPNFNHTPIIAAAASSDLHRHLRKKKKLERSLVRLLSFFKKTTPAAFCVRSTKRPQHCYQPATLSY
jgi:hypothetical protein